MRKRDHAESRAKHRTKNPAYPRGNTRRKERPRDKITQLMTVIKRAVQHGFQALDVLTDRGLSGARLIQAMR